MLYFTPGGLLERNIQLPPEQGINNLDVDKDGNVWTLTDYLGRNDVTTGPLIFVYDRTGRLTNGFLRRTDYPAGFGESNRTGGTVAFGVADGVVWFWQPVRHRMTVVSREGRVLRQVSVVLPKSRNGAARSPLPEADFVAPLSSGRVVDGIVSPWPDVPTGAYVSSGSRFANISPDKNGSLASMVRILYSSRNPPATPRG